MAKTALDWQDIDTDSMYKKTPRLAKLHKAYQAAQDIANTARDALDEAMKIELVSRGVAEDASQVVIGHKWGKLSFAVDVNATRRTRKQAFTFG